MKVISAIIGTGVGTKHLQAIENYKGSKVKIICEKDKKKNINIKEKIPTQDNNSKRKYNF